MRISRKAIHLIIIICVIVIVAICVGVMIQRYEIEGEKNMPFEVSKIMIFSTANGVDNKKVDRKWAFNLNLFQDNDIYISIAKNKNYKKKEIIDKIVLNNFVVSEKPQKGEIVIYQVTSETKTTEAYQEKYEIKDSLEYIGSSESDLKNLKIANQGGMMIFRVSNKGLGTYQSNNEKTVVHHDGTLLAQAKITNEEIKCKVSFDIIIELKSQKKYKGTITLDLPIGNIIKNGQESIEITDFENVVFKRI